MSCNLQCYIQEVKLGHDLGIEVFNINVELIVPRIMSDLYLETIANPLSASVKGSILNFLKQSRRCIDRLTESSYITYRSQSPFRHTTTDQPSTVNVRKKTKRSYHRHSGSVTGITSEPLYIGPCSREFGSRQGQDQVIESLRQ